jgi:hypothetical protein
MCSLASGGIDHTLWYAGIDREVAILTGHTVPKTQQPLLKNLVVLQ